MNKELLNLLPGSWYAPKAAPCCHRPLLLAIMHLYDKILNSSIVSVYNYFLDIYILGVDQSDRMVLSVFVFFIVACLSVFALSVCLLSVFVFLIVALWRCCLSLYSLSSSIFLLLYGVIFCIRTVCPDFFIFFLLCGVVVCLCTVCLHRFSCYSLVWFSVSVPFAWTFFSSCSVAWLSVSELSVLILFRGRRQVLHKLGRPWAVVTQSKRRLLSINQYAPRQSRTRFDVFEITHSALIAPKHRFSVFKSRNAHW